MRTMMLLCLLPLGCASSAIEVDNADTLVDANTMNDASAEAEAGVDATLPVDVYVYRGAVCCQVNEDSGCSSSIYGCLFDCYITAPKFGLPKSLPYLCKVDVDSDIGFGCQACGLGLYCVAPTGSGTTVPCGGER